MNTSILNLCLVTQCNQQSLDKYLYFLERAVIGGVTLVQLRDKTSPLAQVRTMALAFKSLLDSLKTPLIINDYVELAAEIDAHGVHIGQSDLSPQQARHILGADKIIGYSIESYAELERSNSFNCIDYIAASAVFPSTTKNDCKTVWGLAGLQRLAQLSKHPVVAIGGINKNNVTEVIRHGACGVAVVSALHDHADPRTIANELIQKIQQGKHDV